MRLEPDAGGGSLVSRLNFLRLDIPIFSEKILTFIVRGKWTAEAYSNQSNPLSSGNGKLQKIDLDRFSRILRMLVGSNPVKI